MYVRSSRHHRCINLQQQQNKVGGQRAAVRLTTIFIGISISSHEFIILIPNGDAMPSFFLVILLFHFHSIISITYSPRSASFDWTILQSLHAASENGGFSQTSMWLYWRVSRLKYLSGYQTWPDILSSRDSSRTNHAGKVVTASRLGGRLLCVRVWRFLRVQPIPWRWTTTYLPSQVTRLS